MTILLKGVTIVDPSSPFHQQAVDVLIDSGIISRIGSVSAKADQEISVSGMHASVGWVDIFADFGDPGFEYREDMKTGCQTAALGGFTDVFVIPNTAPVHYTKSGVEYLNRRSTGHGVSVYALGAVSKNAEGKELAEMYDMADSGAVGFTDGKNSIQSAGLMLKALQYVKAIDKTVLQIPNDHSISGKGLMNEGKMSTRLGLAGLPAIAEEIMVKRDIELAAYAGSKLHLTGVSSKKSLQLIREAKKNGTMVSCSVTPHHLLFTDEDLYEYNSNLKTIPALRTTEDRDALREGVEDGTVDCIASHHFPYHKDEKLVEFEYAKAGMIGLETAFSAVRTAMPHLSIERVIELLSHNPRNLFALEQPSITEGSPACITLFLPGENWAPEQFASKSKNSPFYNRSLLGKPLGIINRDKLILRPL